MRRVVVTGLGIVSPLATGVEETWSRLADGLSGAGPITKFDASDMACRIACEVKRGDGTRRHLQCRSVDRPQGPAPLRHFIIYALAAAKQAVADSGWEPKTEEDKYATGVLIGSGIGGLAAHRSRRRCFSNEKGPRRVSPFFIPGSLINLASGLVSIEFGCKGPNHAVVTACATGSHAIGDASRMIALGRCRCHGGGRHRSGDLAPRHCGLHCLQGAGHEVQRRAETRLAPL